jgi:hypothetical protein
MNQPYPFDPIQDSLIFSILYEVMESEGKGLELKQAIYSHLKEGKNFFHTPKSQKNNLLNRLPTQIRKWKEVGDIQKIENLILGLIQGRNLEIPSLDLALELVEWIIVGYEEEQLSLQLLKVLANHKLQFTPEHLQKFKDLYSSYVSKETRI